MALSFLESAFLLNFIFSLPIKNICQKNDVVYWINNPTGTCVYFDLNYIPK